MEVTITARHCSVPDPVRERAMRLARDLDRFGARATSAIVNFDAEHNAKNVEARIAVAGGPPLIARADGPTFRSALDRAFDRLERQLKRHRQRRRRRRTGVERPPAGELSA